MERVFCVFSHWHILTFSSKLWYGSDMDDVVTASVIMQNMIVKARGVAGEDWFGIKHIGYIALISSVVPL